MHRLPYRTNYALWAVVGIGVFVALGFVDPVGGASKGDLSYWNFFVQMMSQGNFQRDNGYVQLCIYNVLLGVPSALLGWVIQAAIVVLGNVSRSEPNCETDGAAE